MLTASSGSGGGGEPGVEHLARDLDAGQAQAHHEHVRVVPAPRAGRGRGVGARARRGRPRPCSRRSTRRCRSSRTARPSRRRRGRPPRPPRGRPGPTPSPLRPARRGRTDQRDVVAARSEVVEHRVRERGAFVGAEHELHGSSAAANVAQGLERDELDAVRRAPVRERALGEDDVGEQRRLPVARAVADHHRGPAPVPGVLDRRLLARAAARAGAAAVLVRELEPAGAPSRPRWSGPGCRGARTARRRRSRSRPRRCSPRRPRPGSPATSGSRSGSSGTSAATPAEQVGVVREQVPLVEQADPAADLAGVVLGVDRPASPGSPSRSSRWTPTSRPADRAVEVQEDRRLGQVERAAEARTSGESYRCSPVESRRSRLDKHASDRGVSWRSNDASS